MQPRTIPQQVLAQQTPIISWCYYKPHELRNSREAATPDKENAILKNGARGDRGLSGQN